MVKWHSKSGNGYARWIKPYASRYAEEFYSYSYSLKLALLFRPQDQELHEWILGRMDLDRLKTLHFEIICLLAKYFGCKNRQFKQLFDQKVWLCGLNQPLLSDLKYLPELKEEYELNHQAFTFLTLNRDGDC